jgi:hypothetical protein
MSGVMIRETLTGGSRYAFMGTSASGAIRWQRRSSTSNGTSAAKGGNAAFPNIWVRVVRTGNTLYGYKSTNGSSWTLVSSGTVNMASNIYVGLVAASGSSTVLSTSVFTNITVIP